MDDFKDDAAPAPKTQAEKLWDRVVALPPVSRGELEALLAHAERGEDPVVMTRLQQTQLQAVEEAARTLCRLVIQERDPKAFRGVIEALANVLGMDLRKPLITAAKRMPDGH